MARVATVVFVIFVSACGSQRVHTAPPSPVGGDVATGDEDPPADLSAPPADMSQPPPVDAPIQPPMLLAVTSSGPLVLGAGFEDATRTILPTCLVGPHSFGAGAEAGTGTARANLVERELAGMLAVGYHGSDTDATLYDALPSVRGFLHDAAVASGADLSYFVPVIVANAGNVLFTDDAFTRVGDCGDSFVYQLRLGARLIVGLKLHFVDEPSARTFVDQYGSSLNAILARDDLGWLSVALDHKATIVVAAAQIGGDPRKLQAILDQSRCSIGNLPACNETITNVIQYGREFQGDVGASPANRDSTGGWVPVSGITLPSRLLP